MPIYGDGAQTRDYIYVEDTVRGAIMAYEHPATRGATVNLATGKETMVLDLVGAVYRAAGVPPTFEYLPPRPGDVRRHQGSGRAAHDTFGFEPSFDLEAGMARTLDWYRNRTAGSS